MAYPLRYGDESVEIDISRETSDIIAALPMGNPAERGIVMEALRGASPPLEEFLGDSPSVAILVSDHTRNTGSRVYMPILLDIARRKGRKITIIIAVGLHRPSTRREIVEILGCDPGPEVEIMNHDPDGVLAECGDGLFCEAVVGSAKVILTGSVTFHPMAGFSGGWKSLLPGVASRKDIIENHRRYFAGRGADPRVGPAKVSDNPILEDIHERTRGFSRKTWCLNVVQDEAKSIVRAVAGEVDHAWRACADFLSDHNSPRIDRLYPVVVASAGGYPSDFSFYQSMKTLTNASRCCTEGGSIYLLMECRNGWELGKRDMSLSNLGLEEIAERVKERFTMSGLAAFMALSIIRSRKVSVLSCLPRREIESFGMRHLASGDEIARLASLESADRIAVMPAAAAVLPTFVGP
jgi:nickel-dependent lactate racemase